MCHSKIPDITHLAQVGPQPKSLKNSPWALQRFFFPIPGFFLAWYLLSNGFVCYQVYSTSKFPYRDAFSVNISGVLWKIFTFHQYLRKNRIDVINSCSTSILSLHKIGYISAKQLKQAWLFCSRFALSLQMNFAKECLKTYDALIHYIRKIRYFVIKHLILEMTK